MDIVPLVIKKRKPIKCVKNKINKNMYVKKIIMKIPYK